MDYDPIPDIRKLGYTQREASFLAMVGSYGGYFLRRQFTRYLGRKPGSVDHCLVQKVLKRGHFRALDYGSRRKVFQLISNAVYYLLGRESALARRTKGDLEIKARLIELDYVLDHPGTRFLSSARDKLHYFCHGLNIAHEFIPRRARIDPGRSEGSVHFDDLSPIAVVPGVESQPPLISIVFIDGGHQTDEAFRSFLSRYRPLLERLPRFEVVYVSDSRRNFQPAATLFHHSFADPGPRLANGPDHFLNYMRARSCAEDDPPALDAAQRQLLAQGKDLYAAADYQQIYASWKRGETTFDHILAQEQHPETRPGSIRGYLMQSSYPACLRRPRPLG